MPYLPAGSKAANFHEARSDWEICARLAQAILRRARERGISAFTDRRGNQRRLDTLYDDFSMNGELGPQDEEKVAADLVRLSSNLRA